MLCSFSWSGAKATEILYCIKPELILSSSPLFATCPIHRPAEFDALKQLNVRYYAVSALWSAAAPLTWRPQVRAGKSIFGHLVKESRPITIKSNIQLRWCAAALAVAHTLKLHSDGGWASAASSVDPEPCARGHDPSRLAPHGDDGLDGFQGLGLGLHASQPTNHHPLPLCLFGPSCNVWAGLRCRAIPLVCVWRLTTILKDRAHPFAMKLRAIENVFAALKMTDQCCNPLVIVFEVGLRIVVLSFILGLVSQWEDLTQITLLPSIDSLCF